MTRELYTKFIIILVCVALLALIGFWKYAKDNHAVAIKQEQVLGLVVPETFETKTIKESDDYTTIMVSYPYFKNVPSDFNQRIETLLQEQIKEHKQNSKENWMARVETKSPNDTISTTPSEEDKWPFIATFTIVQSNNNYISYIENYGGFSGGAHGYADNISFAYDVQNKKELTLADMFPQGLDYLKKVSDISLNELKKQYVNVPDENLKDSSQEAVDQYESGILKDIITGTEPKVENFSIFTFTPEKIKIYFGQYQVGPYSIGMPEVEFDR
jgi:hypothetical protein